MPSVYSPLLGRRLIIAPSNSLHCQYALSRSLEICAALGVPLAVQKAEGPTTCLTFLGVEIDTTSWEPQGKLARIHALAFSWHEKRSCRVKDLQCLHGILQDAAKVVPAGKTFNRRVSDLLRLPRATSPNADLRLNGPFHSWWCCFLPHWKGFTLLPPHPSDCHGSVTSDASGSWGCGAVPGNKWFHLKWLQPWQPPQRSYYQSQLL